MNSESTSQKTSRHCRKIKHFAVFETQEIVNFIRLETAVWVCHQVFSRLLSLNYERQATDECQEYCVQLNLCESILGYDLHNRPSFMITKRVIKLAAFYSF